MVAWSVAAAVVACDQLTKNWAVRSLSSGPVHVVWKLDFELGYNSGSAFSLAPGLGPELTVVALVAIALLSFAAARSRSLLVLVGLGLILGGATGNVCDRLFRSHHGSVVDFIAFHFWPTFNLADASIVVGGALVVLAQFVGSEGRNRAGKRDLPGSEDPKSTDERFDGKVQ